MTGFGDKAHCEVHRKYGYHVWNQLKHSRHYHSSYLSCNRFLLILLNYEIQLFVVDQRVAPILADAQSFRVDR